MFGSAAAHAPAPSPSAPATPTAAAQPLSSIAAANAKPMEKPKAFDWSSQDYKTIFTRAADAPSLVPTTSAFEVRVHVACASSNRTAVHTHKHD